MYQIKTKINDNDVSQFISNIDDKRKDDVTILLKLFTKVSGYSPKMFGDSIIGFGSYKYKYESGHSGVAPLLSFSPRKSNITIYIAMYDKKREAYLNRLGKHKASVGCLYINKLSDINLSVLEELLEHSIYVTKKTFPESGDL